MKQKNKKFCNVLTYLKEELNVSEYKLANELNNLEMGLAIDRSLISKYKDVTRKIPIQVIEGLHKKYDINPYYLLGTSDEMLDIAKIHLRCFKKFVKSWKTVEKTYQNEDGNQVTNKYLNLAFDSNFYELLLEINSAEANKEFSDAGYEAHIKDVKEKYTNQKLKLLRHYIVIPQDEFLTILTNEKNKIENLDLQINYEKHFGLVDE